MYSHLLFVAFISTRVSLPNLSLIGNMYVGNSSNILLLFYLFFTSRLLVFQEGLKFDPISKDSSGI